MKLFSYEDRNMINPTLIYVILLVVSAVICVYLLIKALRRETFLGKFLGIVLTCAIGVGLWFLADYAREYRVEEREVYAHYKQAYENGEVVTVRGPVKNFTSTTTSKSFTVDDTHFTIVPIQDATPFEDTTVVMYYTYTEEHYSFFVIYKPEKCVIMGDNQWLEIQYIVEDGENRILYIGEISPEN